MPTGYAGQRLRQSTADSARDGNLPAVPDGADRNHSTESNRRTGRSSSGRTSWNPSADARIARTVERIQRHAANDHLSPRIPVAKPGPEGKTQGLGRHDAGPRAARKTDQRKTAQLFSLR